MAPRKSKRPASALRQPDGLPPSASHDPWIYSQREDGDYPEPTDNSGKWLIFVSADGVDRAWELVSKATADGQLGNASKVSTFRRSARREGHVICVYTYDLTDEGDVRRVRQVLRELGFTQRLFYKSDKDTIGGVYRATGHTNISKYHE